jgi:hypothetical protein
MLAQRRATPFAMRLQAGAPRPKKPQRLFIQSVIDDVDFGAAEFCNNTASPDRHDCVSDLISVLSWLSGSSEAAIANPAARAALLSVSIPMAQ